MTAMPSVPSDMGPGQALWTEFAPSWDELQSMPRPVFVGPQSLRPFVSKLVALAARHPVLTAEAIARRRRPREWLSFLAWAESARAFGIDSVFRPDGSRMPLPRRKVTRRDLSSDARICAALIAQDEAELLGRALESVRPLVDQIVVVDGGSKDETREIARDFGADVVERRFDDDFAAQRNFGLESVRTPWVLMLDADELVSADLVGRLREVVRGSACDAVFVPVLNLIEGEGETPVHWPLVRIRLFRSCYRFRGRVHEQVVGWSRPVFTPISGPYVIHKKSRLRLYRRSLYYSSIDPDYRPEWVAYVQEELRKLESSQDSGD